MGKPKILRSKGAQGADGAHAGTSGGQEAERQENRHGGFVFLPSKTVPKGALSDAWPQRLLRQAGEVTAAVLEENEAESVAIR